MMTLRTDALALPAVGDDLAPELRRSFGAFPTGVVAVCAMVDGQPVGMSMNSFTSISLDPALVAVSVARTSTTWPRLRTAGRIGLSVLGAGQGALCRALSSRSEDRLASAGWRADAGGGILIDGAALWLSCAIRDVFEGGDHEIVLLEVVGLRLHDGVEPLVFHGSRFRELTDAA
jgi:flavin reductase (DIM6/NTAB) family NADH-FMN oxidoreductase RutF